MLQFFPDSTLLPALHRYIGTNLYYFLYSNNLTPGYATVLTDFTHVPFSDIHFQTVAAGSFTLDSISGHLARITAGDITFTCLVDTPAIYGYLVTTAESGGSPLDDLVVAARFDTPLAMGVGDVFNLTPTLALKMSA